MHVPELAAAQQSRLLRVELGLEVRAFGRPLHHVGNCDLDPFALARARHVEQVVADFRQALAIGDVVEQRLDRVTQRHGLAIARLHGVLVGGVELRAELLGQPAAIDVQRERPIEGLVLAPVPLGQCWPRFDPLRYRHTSPPMAQLKISPEFPVREPWSMLPVRGA